MRQRRKKAQAQEDVSLSLNHRYCLDVFHFSLTSTGSPTPRSYGFFAPSTNLRDSCCTLVHVDFKLRVPSDVSGSDCCYAM